MGYDGVSRISGSINHSDINKCLGTAYKNSSEVCRASAINMWSRKKPVEINAPFPNRSANWWVGTAGDCGITPPARVSTFAAVKALYNGGLNGWTSTKPSTYFRLQDFNGYYHKATPQITQLDVPESVLSGNDIPASIGLRSDDTDSTGSGSLNMSEITVDNIALSSWYVGIAIFDGDTVKGWIAERQGLDAQQYEYPTDSSMVGKTYTVVPFYSKVYLSKDSGVSISGALMPLPVLQPMQVKVNSTAILISIGADAMWATNKSSISFSVTAYNESSSQLAFASATARLRFAENAGSASAGWTTTMQSGEYEFNLLNYGLSSSLVAGGQDTSNTITQAISSAYQSKIYVLLVRIVSGSTTFDYGPEEVPESESEIG